MAVFFDTLSGKRLSAVVSVEADAGRQHLANGAYDSVPYSLSNVKWADGSVSQAINAAEYAGGELQRTLAVTVNPSTHALVVVTAGKLNHPHIP